MADLRDHAKPVEPDCVTPGFRFTCPDCERESRCFQRGPGPFIPPRVVVCPRCAGVFQPALLPPSPLGGEGRGEGPTPRPDPIRLELQPPPNRIIRRPC